MNHAMKPGPDMILAAIRPAESMEAKRRKCLACQNMFASEWCGNRVCKKCAVSADFTGRRRGGVAA